MKIYLATDHAGFELKNQIAMYLKTEGYDVEDCGAHAMDSTDDYPDFIKIAAKKVADNPGSFGIVFGKSGAGECIVANKIKGIRSFLAVNAKNVQLAREHNDANVMSVGSDLISFSEIPNLLDLFLKTPFTNEERHARRIEKIKAIENNE